MKDLTCQLCSAQFDMKRHVPRLFSNCGHTFCSKCINDMIDQTKGKMMCPEDGIVCEFFNKEIGVKCFPLNYAIHRLLKKRKNTLSNKHIKLEQKTVKKEKPGLNCPQHLKKCDLVCIVDQKPICPDCVLFGVHSDHEYKKIKQFQLDTKDKLNDLKAHKEVLKQSAFIRNSGKWILDLKNKVAKRKEELSDEIEGRIESLIDCIKEKGKELKENLEEAFQFSEKAITAACLKDSDYVENFKRIDTQIDKLEKQAKNNSFDYPLVFSSLFSKDNLTNKIKKLSIDFEELETKELFYMKEELKKIVLKDNSQNLVSLIRSSIFINKQDDDNKMNTSTREKSLKSRNVKTSRKAINVFKEDNSCFTDSNNVSNNNIKRDSISLIDINFEDEIDSLELDSEDNQPQNKPINHFYNKPGFNHRVMTRQTVRTNEVNKFNRSINMGEVKRNSVNNFSEYQIKTNRSYLAPIPEVNTYGSLNRIKTENSYKSPVKKNEVRSRFNKLKIGSNRSIKNIDLPIPKMSLGVRGGVEIDYSGFTINDHNVLGIISEVLKNNRIRELNLNNNTITEIGFEQIIKKLAAHPSLEKIHLMGNYLDDTVFIKLQQMIGKFKKIKYFNLRNCRQFKNIVQIGKYVRSLKRKGITVDV